MQPIVNLFEYERLAKARMTPMAFDYYASGAMDEITVRANRRAFDEIFLRYRVLAGVGTRDTTTTVLGQPVPMPVLVAPSAFHCLAHPLGERATAAGAAAAGIIYVMSTLSTTKMKEVAQLSTGPRWFQLYVYKDRGRNPFVGGAGRGRRFHRTGIDGRCAGAGAARGRRAESIQSS